MCELLRYLFFINCFEMSKAIIITNRRYKTFSLTILILHVTTKILIIKNKYFLNTITTSLIITFILILIFYNNTICYPLKKLSDNNYYNYSNYLKQVNY